MRRPQVARMRQVYLHRDEDRWWVAEVPSLPGCVSQGATREDALENIREAIAGVTATFALVAWMCPMIRWTRIWSRSTREAATRCLGAALRPGPLMETARDAAKAKPA